MKSCFSSFSRRAGRVTAIMCLALAVSAAAAAAQSGIPGYVILPLLVMDRANQASVDAEVNGRRTRLILDTGSPTTLLDSTFYRHSLPKTGDAKPADLPPELRKKTDANGQKASYAMASDLKLGGLDLGKRPVVLTDLNANLGGYNRRHGGEAVSGLVGLDLLHEYGAIIDWRRHGIYLNVDKSKRLKLGPSLVAAGWTAVPLTGTSAHHLGLEATVEGKKVRLLMDTGSQFTTFVPSVVPFNGMLYNLGKKGPTGSHIQNTGITMSMINSSAAAYPAKVEHWKLGNFEIASSVVIVSALPSSLLKESTAGAGPMLGLLGAEVLARHNAIIDVSASTLYLKH